MLYDKNSFTYTTADLAEAHGTSSNTISTWTQEGAFPFARREGERTTLYYPASTLRLTMGEIKKNRDAGKFKEPKFLFDPLPQPKKKVNQSSESMVYYFDKVLDRIDELDRKVTRHMTRLETKLHAVAEGRELIAAEHHQEHKPNTVGDMLKRSFNK